MMQKLSVECYCSDLKVYLKNWLAPKASTKRDWYIFYRFYDPKFKGNPQYKEGKLVLLKRMNSFNELNHYKFECKIINSFTIF